MCYRHYDEEKINFICLDTDYQEQKSKPFIDLKPMLEMNERYIKYVTFDGIKKDSFLRYRDELAHDQEGISHLLSVTITNTNYVFDLDACLMKNKKLLANLDNPINSKEQKEKIIGKMKSI